MGPMMIMMGNITRLYVCRYFSDDRMELKIFTEGGKTTNLALAI